MKLARMRDRIEYRQLRAPQASGHALIDPSPAEAAELLIENRRRLGFSPKGDSSACEIAGQPCAELAATARRQLLDEAVWYTRSYRDIEPPTVLPDTPLLLAGHQPQLFHPGVWFKNFVLSSLAAQNGGVALNLIIDSDALKSAAITVPTGTRDNPGRTKIPFDSPASEIPYEERRIINADTFDRFGGEVEAAIAGLVPDPVIRELWPLAIERRTAGATLGECLAQSRHILERQWGGHTLELPQSAVCNLDAFFSFAAHLLNELPRFREVYNRTLAEYRQVHRLRNRAHPVPDLVQEDEWIESPFWIWSREEPQRRPLFIAHRGRQLVLADLAQNEWRLDGNRPNRLAQQLADLAKAGVKLRTRALTTTLFARLLLGDLFLHGIGGAKYDQVTDLVIKRFFGMSPPSLMTVTATVRLPLDRPLALPEDDRRLGVLLRELEYHPERYLPDSDRNSHKSEQIDRIIADKHRWIATPKTVENAAVRHRHITLANEQLQPWVAGQRERLLEQRDALRQQIRGDQILGSREYAFCLHPTKKLQNLILDLSTDNP